MDSIKINELRWRNYHKISFPLEDSISYFQRDDLLINDSFRMRILETLNSMVELRNELYRNIYDSVKVPPMQRKLF